MKTQKAKKSFVEFEAKRLEKNQLQFIKGGHAKKKIIDDDLEGD